MNFHACRPLCIAAIFFELAFIPMKALACDEPGTPNNDLARSIFASPDTNNGIEFSFDNTASEYDNIYFDIEVKEPTDRDHWNWYDNASAGHRLSADNRRVTFHINTQQLNHVNSGNYKPDRVNQPLLPAHTYCFRAWARVGENGCASKVPSAWQCARMPPF